MGDIRTLVVAGFGTTSTQLALTFGILSDPRNKAVAERAGRETATAMSLGLERDTFRERTAFANGLFCETLRLLPILQSSNGKTHSDICVEVDGITFSRSLTPCCHKCER